MANFETKGLKDYMSLAINESNLAKKEGEVPVGAIIVHNKQVVSSAHNKTVLNCNLTDHAEMLCIKDATSKLGCSFLTKCDIYVTMEPCPMCAYAICLSRIRRVYFGCFDFKNGGFGGRIHILNSGLHVHKPEIFGGIREEECEKTLKDFFISKRNKTT